MFDHNKLQEYKDAMKLLVVRISITENDQDHIKLKFIEINEQNFYSIEDAYKVIATSKDFEEFKMKVANYFLNK